MLAGWSFCVAAVGSIVWITMTIYPYFGRLAIAGHLTVQRHFTSTQCCHRPNTWLGQWQKIEMTIELPDGGQSGREAASW